MQPVDQSEVDDVDPQLGVDDVAHGLLEVVQRGGAGARGGRGLGHARRAPHYRVLDPVPGGVLDPVPGGVLDTHAVSFSVFNSAVSDAKPRTTASLNAIQPSSAHLTRAG